MGYFPDGLAAAAGGLHLRAGGGGGAGGASVYPDGREEQTRALTGLMDGVFARLSPPLSRLALCDLPRGKPKAVDEAGFRRRWTDLLDLVKLVWVKNKVMAQEAE